MPRGARKIKKRLIPPDPKYQSVEVAKFINYLMLDGQKAKAWAILEQTFEGLKKAAGVEALTVFLEAVKKASPRLEVRPRRIGGATYQVPMEVLPERQKTLAMKWLIEAARKRQGKPMADFLTEEILAAYKGEGVVIRRRDELHKLAEANRAFAHYGRF